jgi:chorismate--pyruvate lyase
MKQTHRQRWKTRHQLPRQTIPLEWQSWLFDEKSLTKRLQQRCNGSFAVDVLSEQVCQPQLQEARKLMMGQRHWARIRQVLLLCNGEPWVAARTIIPLSTLRGPLRRLRYLKNRPLGAFLFADPHLERGEIEVAQLTYNAPPLSLLTGECGNTNESPWARRSLFKLRGRPVLVAEVFLNALITH